MKTDEEDVGDHHGAYETGQKAIQYGPEVVM